VRKVDASSQLPYWIDVSRKWFMVRFGPRLFRFKNERITTLRLCRMNACRMTVAKHGFTGATRVAESTMVKIYTEPQDSSP